jgi:hypothetical protein
MEGLVKVVTLQLRTTEDRSQSFCIVSVFATGLFSWLKMKSSKQDGVVFTGDIILRVEVVVVGVRF